MNHRTVFGVVAVGERGWSGVGQRVWLASARQIRADLCGYGVAMHFAGDGG